MEPGTALAADVGAAKDQGGAFQKSQAAPPRSSATPRKISAPRVAPLRASSRHVGMSSSRSVTQPRITSAAVSGSLRGKMFRP
jgi:hypothetical protein